MRPSLRSGFKHSSNGAQEAPGGPNRAQEAPGGPYVKLFVVMYGRNGVDLCSSSSTVAMAAVSTWRRAIETLRASSTFAEFARMLEILRLTLTNRPILAHLIATPLPSPHHPAPPAPPDTHTHPHTRLPYTHTRAPLAPPHKQVDAETVPKFAHSPPYLPNPVRPANPQPPHPRRT